MRSLIVTILILGMAGSSAMAQSITRGKNDNKSFGLSLPSPSSNYGSDEIRAADGTTCRSSMSGNGPRLDFGGIGVPKQDGEKAFSAVYGRIVVPLTSQPRRLDCHELYQLELERLRHELEMVRGTSGQLFDEIGGDWASDGWSDPSVQ